MPPSFENFSLDTLSSEQKPSLKKLVDRAGQKPADQPAMILKFTGRVEKSVSDLKHKIGSPSIGSFKIQAELRSFKIQNSEYCLQLIINLS